jgi:hypothetical protein
MAGKRGLTKQTGKTKVAPMSKVPKNPKAQPTR